MVLQPVNRRRRIGRLASDVENRKPSFSASGAPSRARKQTSKPKLAAKACRVPGSHRALHDTRRRTSSVLLKKRTMTSILEIKQELPAETEMMDVDLPASSSAQRTILRFPRHLSHPATRYPTSEALNAAGVDPKANLQYCRSVLRSTGPEIWRVLTSCTFDLPAEQIPDTLDITVNEVVQGPPTHAFAIWPLADRNLRNSSAPTPVRIYPFHKNVVAVNAAHLPVLPSVPETGPCSPGSKVNVPVVPLAVPSPSSFKDLLHYLYSKDVASLFEALFPCPVPTVKGQSPRDLVHEYAAKIAREYSRDDILRHVAFAHGLWHNICYLGVFDDSLWAMLDAAWEILLTALMLKQSTHT